LARTLAERSGADYLKVGLAPLLERISLYHGDVAGMAAEFEQLLEQRRQVEAGSSAFVADRSPADMLAIWLALQDGPEAGKLTAALHAACARHMAGYGMIVIPPFGVFPLRPKDAGQPGVRNLQPWVQLLSHGLITGLALHFVGMQKVLSIPRDLPPDAWCDFVLARVPG